jgi:hypothetical protein
MITPEAERAEIIVKRRVERVTKISGSGLDEWIYWHFGYKFS